MTEAATTQTPEAQPLAAGELMSWSPPLEDHGLCLVVADRGHVWVGVTRTEGDWVLIDGARIVRRWGTTKGLNQLATSGPTGTTQLDAPADVKLNRRALIALVPCEAAKWAA